MADIKHHRLRLGLTQASLSAQLGVTPAAVSAWERGVARPGSEVAQRLEEVLGLTAGSLAHSGHYGRNISAPQPSTPLDGSALAQWRKQRGLTLRELEALTGISRQTLSRWERGLGCRKNVEAVERLMALL